MLVARVRTILILAGHEYAECDWHRYNQVVLPVTFEMSPPLAHANDQPPPSMARDLIRS